MNQLYRTTRYRYPNERWILAITVCAVLLVIAITATATVCVSLLFVLYALVFSFLYTNSKTKGLISSAQQVTSQDTPELAAAAGQAAARLQVEPVQIFITPSRILNAYTFGLLSPRSIVLNTALLNVMDRDEMQFIIGHEMGHVILGHTWLNSLIGGMAGIPSPSEASLLLALAFRWWNRACEYSADRAGMLSCNHPQKAVSALVKLQAGPGLMTQERMEQVLRAIETEDDEFLNNLAEIFATHPMMVHRIDMLRRYAASAEYQQIRARMDQNLISLSRSIQAHQ